MKRTLNLITLALCCMNIQAQVTFNLDAGRRGAAISPLHYGIFFEEINHAGEGGLYAELVRNRSFEENASNYDYWKKLGDSELSLDTSKPLNDVNKTALKIKINNAGGGVSNEGFWGMNIVSGNTYKATLWARSESNTYDGELTLSMQTIVGRDLGSKTISGITSEWKKFTVEIPATGNNTSGRLAITGSTAGTVFIDVVSLFPPTYKGRENGCRIDLAEKLEALHPAFMRFPGGCYVEGNWTEDHPQTNHFKWKETIGPIEERPGHYNNNWFYPVTDGLGMLEFLLLCEDFNCEPLYVVNMGMGHGWEDPNVEWYIQDALDAIEFCNGDANTTVWGKKRAELGHPEPFNLRLIEIGNENYWFGPYADRYEMFRKRIAAAFPETIFIGDGDGILWNIPHPVDIIDQHYYMTPAWFTGEYHRYDNYDRNTYKIYVGEYAVTGACGRYGNMNAALGEAAFMCGMENNSDVVTMTSYAPILCNENNYQWAPDIIRFNSGMSYCTPSYYVQQMMADNVGKQNIKWTEENNTYEAKNKVGLSSWGTSVAYDNLLVTSLEGDTLYFNDFSSTNLSEFTSNGGTWTVRNGQLQQTDQGMAGAIFTLNREFGSDYIVQCDAVKTGGNEGFLLCFNITSSEDYVWWNVGGWANKKQGIEQAMSGTRGSDMNDAKDFDGIKNGTTYSLRVRLKGNDVQCYLDKKQVNSKTLTTKSQRIYLAANIDDDTQTLYVKAVNPYRTMQSVTFNINNAVFESGDVVVLGSSNGSDENTTNNPNFILPKTRTLRDTQLSENTLKYNIAGHSFYIFRLKVSPASVEQQPLPEPLVKYSFEPATQTDDSGKWEYTLKSDGSIATMHDGSHSFYSGKSGFLSMGTDMPHEILPQLSGDYSVSIDIMPNDITPLNSFSWAYGIANGTSSYIGLVNSPTNRNWYYEARNTPANSAVAANGGLLVGKWHNVVYTQQDGTGKIYIDGCLLGTVDNIETNPSKFAAAITSACIARSPFSGDALMTQAYFDDFQIFGEALTEGQVSTLYSNTQCRAYTDHTPTGISTIYAGTEKERTSYPDGVYTLQGQRISDSINNLNGYHGIVVSKGRKYMIK